MHLRLIRHATLVVHVGTHRLVVDPQLDPAGSRPPVPDTPLPRPNPLVGLPEPAAAVLAGIDGMLLTHLHGDHIDETALGLLPRDLVVLCQAPDAEHLRTAGFTDVRPVEDELEWDGLRVIRIDARHGTGDLAAAMAPVSGYVLIAEAEPVLYIAGDTVFYEGVAEALETHAPNAVVVNAGGARFTSGDPITMTAEDVLRVVEAAPQARVIAVHLDAINHCVETRADLRQRLREADVHEGVTVPEDGAEVPVMLVGG